MSKRGSEKVSLPKIGYFFALNLFMSLSVVNFAVDMATAS